MALALGFDPQQLEWNGKPQSQIFDMKKKIIKRKKIKSRSDPGEEEEEPAAAPGRDKMMRLLAYTAAKPVDINASIESTGKFELSMEKGARADYPVTMHIDDEIDDKKMEQHFMEFSYRLKNIVKRETEFLLTNSQPKHTYLNSDSPFELPVGSGGSKTGQLQLKLQGSHPDSKLEAEGPLSGDHIYIRKIVTNPGNIFGLPVKLRSSPAGVAADVNVSLDGLRLPKIGVFMQSLGNRIFFDGDNTINGSLLALVKPGYDHQTQLFSNTLESSSVLQKMNLNTILIESYGHDPGILDLTFSLYLLAEVSW